MRQAPWARALEDSGWQVSLITTHTPEGEFVVYGWYPRAGQAVEQGWVPHMKIEKDNQPRRNFVSGPPYRGRVHLVLTAATRIRDALDRSVFLGKMGTPVVTFRFTHAPISQEDIADVHPLLFARG